MCVVHQDRNRLKMHFVRIIDESGKEQKFPKSPKIDLKIFWLKDQGRKLLLRALSFSSPCDPLKVQSSHSHPPDTFSQVGNVAQAALLPPPTREAGCGNNLKIDSF